MLTSAMALRNYQYRRARSRERSPLRSGRSSTSYGSFTGVPRPPSQGPPPPYVPYHSRSGGGSPSSNPPPTWPATADNKISDGSVGFGVATILLIVVAQAVVFVFFYDLPSKIGQYNRTMVRMREETQHLHTERVALQSEANRLERERITLEYATGKMEGEKDALESAIRRSELERSRFEQERELMEDERQLLEQEKQELRSERERWEKAREDRVPQGAFWDALWESVECLAYGKREYWGILQNIPGDWTAMDACMNTPAEIKGVPVRRPDRCGYVEGSPHIHGYWMVDWDQADCKPWYRDFHDKVRSITMDSTP